jgi:hypothetical protein
MKVLPRHEQDENLNLQEDKALKAYNGLRGGHPPASHAGQRAVQVITIVQGIHTRGTGPHLTGCVEGGAAAFLAGKPPAVPAVRHKAPVLIVVANNGAWQIEVHDQTVTQGKVVGTKLQFAD